MPYDDADIYTIGHSSRSLEELLEALHAHGVRRLVGVRTAPSSRHVPHFNGETLAQVAPASGIDYVHMKELGGWRKGSRADSPNAGWRSAGFRAYADYMLTGEFQSALDRLISLSRDAPTAIMCAEATPWRCHRMLVSDVLAARGLHVRHIADASRGEQHRMTSFALVENERVTYPPA